MCVYERETETERRHGQMGMEATDAEQKQSGGQHEEKGKMVNGIWGRENNMNEKERKLQRSLTQDQGW